MRIAIFTDTYFPQVNGVVTSIDILSKGLAAREHDVTIVAPHFKQYKDKRQRHITIIREPSIPAFFYEDFKFTLAPNPSLYFLATKRKFDIIHFMTPGTIGLNAITLSRMRNLPLIGTFHTFIADPQYLKHIRINTGFMQRIVWNYCSMSYNACDLVTSPAQTTKEELISKGFKKPIKVISNGISFDGFDDSSAKQFRKRYGIGKKAFLFVGRVSYEKNIHKLVAAFARAHDKDPELQLLIIGDGPQSGLVKEEVKKRDLEESILMLGKIKHDELIKSGVFGSVIGFVTASTTENQPMTVLEAQINGLVVIGPDARGIKDLVEHGKNGLLYPPQRLSQLSAGILEIASDTKKRKAMSKQTLKMVKQHSISKVIDTWEEVYMDLIEKKKESHRS